jgi:hypothetical protein
MSRQHELHLPPVCGKCKLSVLLKDSVKKGGISQHEQTPAKDMDRVAVRTLCFKCASIEPGV